MEKVLSTKTDLINQAFENLGIKGDMEGIKYLREIITCICAGKFSRKDNFHKVVFPYIAEKFETNNASIERCLRMIILQSWYTTSDEEKRANLCSWSVNSQLAFSNKEFILILAENISRKCNAMNQEKDKINEDSEQE
ncbi:MAG: sporulation initiation factor Spo0A C-terminal domain-containing protein [Ruminococcus sp.]|nr:sporulation initiation factor Spo0A C-terminal domain-containing protein [Ruminococcus sp.]